MLALGIALGFLGIGYWAHDVHEDLPKSIFFHLFLVQEYMGVQNLVGGSWTLSLEMAWYAFFSLVFFLKLHHRWRYLWLSAGVFLLVSIGLALLLKHRLPFGRFGMFVTCIMGYFFYMNSRGRLPHGQLLRITGSLFFLILAGLFVSADLGDKRYSLMCSFLSWSGAYALFILFFATRFLKTHFDLLFVYLGSISYSVYLVHCLLIPVLSIYLGTSFWLLIVGAVLSIGAATFTYRYVEQPGIRLGKSLAEVIVASSGRLAPNERLDGSGQGVARICRLAEPRKAGQRRKEQKVSDEFHVFPFRSVLTQSSLASNASAMSLCGLFCLAACRTYGDD